MAVDVRTLADDHDVLPDLITAAAERIGLTADVTVTDAGYYADRRKRIAPA